MVLLFYFKFIKPIFLQADYMGLLYEYKKLANRQIDNEMNHINRLKKR